METKENRRKNTKKKSHGMSKTLSIVILVVIFISLVLGGVFAFVSLDNGELGVYNYNAYANNIKLGLDVKGGVYAVFDVDKEDYIDDKYVGDPDNLDASFDAAVDGTVSRLTDLLFSKGYTEALVTTSGTSADKKIRVEVPDVDDPDEIFKLISKPATLAMYEVADDDGDGVMEKVDPDSDPLVDGTHIELANVGQQEGKFVIQLKFNTEGTKAFADATTALSGKNLGIYLDGELIMSPTVNDPITNGEAVIEGEYTYEQAYEYAVKIQSGALQVKLTMDSSSVISASLGDNALKQGLIAGGVGLLLIIMLLCYRYRLLGVAASISLIFFALTYLFFLSIFPWVQLTLPGIAGILLAIGMAVDANVIIFERIRELFAGNNMRDIKSSINEGFKNSLSAIMDGNVTTIIGAVVLIFVTTATIKGFAITLLIGIIISLISSLVFTRLVIKCFTAINSNSTKLYGLDIKEVDYHIDYKNDGSEEPFRLFKKKSKTSLAYATGVIDAEVSDEMEVINELQPASNVQVMADASVIEDDQNNDPDDDKTTEVQA